MVLHNLGRYSGRINRAQRSFSDRDTRFSGTPVLRSKRDPPDCVLNTRIPVWTLIQLQRLGRTEEQLLTDFPSLTQSHLDAAWDYYRSNVSEIEADIAGQEQDEPAAAGSGISVNW